MADFHRAFEAIDEDGSGEITVDELQSYMMKNNYKANFVTKWLKLFDDDNCGKITYDHYCNTLGLVPRDRKASIVEASVVKPEAAEMTETVPGSSVSNNDLPSNTVAPETTVVQKKKKKSSGRRVVPFSQHKRRLRASLRPGVVVILLAGRHRGKRVVMLSQLASGLLLVTGPYRINGCPLRRVHQSMVIATTTEIDISGVQVPDHLNDSYFARAGGRTQKSNIDVSSIFATKTKEGEYVLRDDRKKDQKKLDGQVLQAIKAREDRHLLVKYLRAPFSLSSHDCPHKMRF